MRVPLSWLKEFVDIELTPEELADRLTLAGLEVSAIDYVGAAPAPGSVWAPDLNAAAPPEYFPWDRERILVGERSAKWKRDGRVAVAVRYGGGHGSLAVVREGSTGSLAWTGLAP